jgi:SNF2-related domain
MNCNNQRILDLIDILHASAARDAESHDSYFTSFYWNISQNASKEKHRTATPGIAGCVTPGGDFFVPSEGRPLLGCEKLLLQGIPYFRLALGNETEVQLGDLAGNAMSLTVVCAAMMGAITCRQLRNELKGSLSLDSIAQHLGKKCALDSYTKSCRWNGSVICSKHESNISYYDCDNKFFSDLAHLAKEAVDSSLWCTCETSGSMSNATSFLECTRCRISCCRNCTGTTAGYNLDGHEMVEVHLCYQVHACCDMQLKLRSIAPSSLMISKEGFQEIASLQEDRARVSGLHDLEFQLHRLKRNRRKWDIIYYARDNNGIGENLAEFKISVGEIERKERGATLLGVTAELKSFLPAKTEPLHYGIIAPCARFTMSSGCSRGIWMGKSSNTSVKTNVVGIGFTDSNRVEVGLSDDAEMALLDHISKARVEKDFEASKRRGEERRWIYAKNWKVWPEKIVIDKISSHDGNLHIDGEYIRCHCRRTINQGALWMKSGSDASPSLFLLLRPNVFRTGPDTAIISTSSNYEDTLSVIAEFPFKWEPCDSLDKGKHCQELIFQGMKNLQRITCLIPKSELSVTSKGENEDTLLILRGLSKSEIQMFRRESDLSGKFRLNVSSGPQAQHIVRVFNTICVPRILKHAATFGIKLDLSPHANWEYLQPANKAIPFGTCNTTIPDPPRETWYFCDERKSWERSSEPGASRAYYLALQAAPTPFEIWLDTDERAIEVKFFPEVVAHNAAGQLIRGRGNIDFTKEVKVYYRLSDISQQSDPITTLFKVHNCNEFPAMNVPLKSTYSLYERQQKVVSKMLAIEDKQTTFEELEMSEFEMPGSSGFSLAAKAVRETTICGGVIADAIGAGKTVISIALILQDIEKSRRERALPNKSSATLVAVPPGLIDQWHAEVKKFSDYLTVVKIYDFSSMLKVKLSDMVAADIVIINVDILQSEGYLENLLKKAGLANEVKNLPCLPQYAGQIEQTQARGVWIPSTSNDPYGGANNPNNQKRRNHTAFYTTIYNKGVLALREKSFNDFDRGIPIEYFEYHRIIVDEIHESLCTTRNELKSEKETADRENGSFYKEKNRRAARELLGITEKDIRKRPLTCRKAIFGLTGTPLLDSSGRIIELANLMGGTYIIGLSSHWRKLERESCRDIFLHNYLEPRQSREIRKNINLKCQAFLDTACTRNKADEEMEGINLCDHRRVIRMSQAEKKAYLQSQSGISAANKSLSIKPEDFDASAGHDISKFLRQNANLACRGEMLITICKEILQKDPETKIVVFADGRIEAGISARNCLIESGLGCTWLDKHDSVQEKNKKIAWYQSADATAEDHKRPRVLVLNFAHAAGLNLQKECYNLILYTPLYVGEGGSSGDPVADASTELQAIGRVYRPGQSQPTVNLFRIEVQGPEGEECLDGMLIRRNTDPGTKAMAINASD